MQTARSAGCRHARCLSLTGFGASELCSRGASTFDLVGIVAIIMYAVLASWGSSLRWDFSVVVPVGFAHGEPDREGTYLREFRIPI